MGHPVWATVVVAFMLVAGAATGQAWQKRAERREQTAGLSAYVLAVNPVMHAASIQQ